jgi:hypothetical protein
MLRPSEDGACSANAKVPLPVTSEVTSSANQRPELTAPVFATAALLSAGRVLHVTLRSPQTLSVR